MRRLLVLLFLLAGCTPALPATVAPLPTLVPPPESISPLFFWQTETGQLSAGEYDLWQFGAQAGDNIFIRTVRRGVDIRLTLTLGDTLIAEGANVLQLTLPASDLYQVRVDHVSGAGQYDIGIGYTDRDNPAEVQARNIPQVVGVPTPTVAFSSLGDFITTLTEPGDYAALLTENSPRHVYTLEGTAGQVVNLALYRIAGTLDPLLRLYDEDDDLVAMDDNSLDDGAARLLNVILPEDGLYSVQVDGKGATGDYTLVFTDDEVAFEPDPLPTVLPTSVVPYATQMIRFAVPDQRLEDHRPAINSITRAGDFQRFSFYAEAGERISMVVEPLEGSSIIPAFEVFDPEGAQLTFASALTSDANGAAAANGIIIGQTGAHIIIVTAEDNTTGQFIISFGRGASVRDEFMGYAFSNAEINGQITSVGTRHIWQLDLDPQDVVSIAVSPDNPEFDPVIELVTATGDLLYRDDDGGLGNAANIRVAEILSPATYLLRIYDETGTNTGGYTMLWNYVEIAPTPTPIPAVTNLLVVEDEVAEGAYQFYAFQGRAGQQVRIMVMADPESALDPVMAVLDPDGEIILEADDSANSLNPSEILTLPENGTYQVRVNGYLSGGNFSLVVSILFN